MFDGFWWGTAGVGVKSVGAERAVGFFVDNSVLVGEDGIESVVCWESVVGEADLKVSEIVGA